MNERERRDFDAGLSEEVDVWLRGDSSRRSFLTKMMLMGGAAMLPGLGFTAASSRPPASRSAGTRTIGCGSCCNSNTWT